MKKSIISIFVALLIFISNGSKAENAFTKALRTCDQYSQLGGASFENEHYDILITLEKKKKSCVYKEKVSKIPGYQMLVCNFDFAYLNQIADSMDRFTTIYKKEVEKNKIYEAKLTANGEIFETFIINPKYCTVEKSKRK